MIPAQFQYAAPASIPDAIALLKSNPDAKILSGGQSLIPLMKFRLAQPAMIVDLNNIGGLDYIREQGGWLKIGALARESELEDSALVREKYPLLYDTTLSVADPIVRNRATLAGNLAHADPANDHPATMLAYRAQVVATGTSGNRTIAIDDFFQGLFATALASDEILSEVQIPAPVARSGGAYFKMERKVGDFATAGVAVQLNLDASGKIEQIGIGLTNVGLQALRAKRSEDALRGEMPDAKWIERAAMFAQEDCEPNADLRGGVEYKRNLVRVLTMRAIEKAVARARGNG
ncbi:MAG: xanthine dehydrogenase family protein subunit M [Chloroflexota bacterium]|nr:MAG: xanthine dehydrogenase family protein subunit M [Chloroflexota bacterium]